MPTNKVVTASFILLLLFYCNNLYAQQTNVTFKVSNNKKEPVQFATITVSPLSDSTQLLQKVSDSSGSATFALSQGIQYIVNISSVNYQPFRRGITVKNPNAIFDFKLEAATNTLQNVVVTATRPLLRQEDDKTIVDPESLAASSTNAFEIIEKTPGLFVDQDGNIYLNSMTPATVHINGREQKMSTTDIATMLKSLPPNSIEKIEILRTPSAKYDASGGGGIVNVVLKKGIRIGLTGSVTAGFNQGRYGNRFTGFNLSNSNGPRSTYLNFQYTKRNNHEQLKTDRLFAPDSLLRQDANTLYPANSFYTGFGVAYQLSKKWEANYDGRISYNSSANRSSNISDIIKISTENTITRNEANFKNKGRSFNTTHSASVKYRMDSIGSEWTTDFSYTYSPNNTDQRFTTLFLTPAFPPVSGDGEIDNTLKFYSAQTNLLKKLPNRITIEAGLKATNVRFNNNTNYFRQSGGTRSKDNIRSGAYRYNENINAAYLQGSKNLSGVIIKAGARLENTNMEGTQLVPNDTSFSLHRTDIFPYVYISRSLLKIFTYELRGYLVYRRTINRPAYEQLNPSLRYVDQYLFETGNPTLRPQFTQNYEANVSFEERPILAIGVNDTKDIFNQVVYQADSTSSIAFRTFDNLGTNKELYFRALGALPPGGKYFFVLGSQYNRNFYQGLYQNKPLSFKRGSWSFFTYHQLKLTPTTTFTLNGFVRLNGQIQFYELSTFGSLNTSLSRQFFNKKLVATISATDIFLTNNNEFTLQQGAVDASGFRKGDTRRFGLNLRYNFGIRKKQEQNMPDLEAIDK